MLEISIAAKLAPRVTNVNSQIAYTSPGTYNFIVPAGVYAVSAVAVGAGGGGGAAGGAGGCLAYANNIQVNPGDVLTVVVGRGGAGVTYERSASTRQAAGSAGGASSIKHNGSTVVLLANGGGGGTASTGGKSSIGSIPPGTIAYPGGSGGGASSSEAGGGGGAGGYYGGGGYGTKGEVFTTTVNTAYGAGAGGTGLDNTWLNIKEASSGGGVGIIMAGDSGIGPRSIPSTGYSGGGSQYPRPQNYGAGGGGGTYKHDGSAYIRHASVAGTTGAVRIIWGEGRQYPSTRTFDY